MLRARRGGGGERPSTAAGVADAAAAYAAPAPPRATAAAAAAAPGSTRRALAAHLDGEAHASRQRIPRELCGTVAAGVPERGRQPRQLWRQAMLQTRGQRQLRGGNGSAHTQPRHVNSCTDAPNAAASSLRRATCTEAHSSSRMRTETAVHTSSGDRRTLSDTAS
jgi:hypothetical protein